MPEHTTYRLVSPATVDARSMNKPVELDDDQRRVVEHESGPMLVLAGPGTGKTTTLVEAIADRIERRGVDPSRILALTFSRKAAESLRDRVTARVGRTLADDLSRTFHSFAYGLLRAYAPPRLYETPLRLLSAPEQDVVLQELLTDADEAVTWPDELRRAVGTRGFAREVLDVLARAREKGLEGPALARLGRENALPEFVAAGHFLEHYLTVLDSLGAVDYPDLIRRAVLDAEEHRSELRARFTHVFVDEYQDTDPSQVRLLRALAGDPTSDRELVVVGDPHQSIYGFRGADVGGILRFPTDFPRYDGSPAEVVALRTTRRFGPRLLVATQRVASRLAFIGSVPEAARQAFAEPRAEADADGLVEIFTYDTDRAEAEHLADLLRRAHLEQGLGWSEMAVLVRSAQQTLPGLQRALAAADVPVEVAADDTPLVREPAVAPLLACLQAVLHGHVSDPSDPHYVHPTAIGDLLVSPLVELDATELRALARQLRTAQPKDAPAVPSAELVRAAVLDPSLLDGLGGVDGEPVQLAASFGRLLRRARQALEAGGTAEDVLWTIWSGTRWPARLRARTEAGGQAARLAHRDLDAICALFDEAARSEQRHGHRSVREFTETLQAQQIPADTLAERGIRGEAVRLLTAHRGKGLEWPLVVVAHVQEETWPDLRRRNTLLRADRIGADGLVDPVSARAMLTEERRLFYVACTRARQRLVVTAVASADPDGDQPSRFLGELGVRVVHRQGRPRRPLSLAGLVAELRRTVADPEADDGLRDAAARRLARLAAERDRAGRPLVPAADPGTWWGLRRLTVADLPFRPADEPVRVSASTLAGLIECPAKWFLEREAGGACKPSQSQGFGNIAHALCDRVARDDLPAGPDDVALLMAEVDKVWGRLAFRTPWSGGRERRELEAALERFLAWHHAARDRTWLASEAPFTCTVDLPDGQQVTLHGRADRLELDAEGRVVVVDLKTGKYPPTDASLTDNPQLGLYQLAVESGGFGDAVPEPAVSGGAELWQLRKDSRGRLKVQVQEPQEPGEDGLTVIQRQLMAAVTSLREERLEVRPEEQRCNRCAFQRLCPAQQSGTVLT